ncbi:hypothetical protein GCM10008171_09780 [Methylopila jiangsuensis]|uniref:Uncharacterized protein n=1 Tax=Methylopila jiangsuensis TaxID=586230 RepID=A0A9W6JH92_9HYPH|nr:hypothetical protein GCM10008171_09780 [Methylopila jiangsuensis]
MRQADPERTALLVLQRNLMDPALVATFCEECAAHLNRLRIERNAAIEGYRAELVKLDRQDDRMVQAIKDGFATPKLKEDMHVLLDRRKELRWLLMSTQEAPAPLNPNMALRERQEVASLIRAMSEPDSRAEATGLVRALVERIVITPDPKDGLVIDVHGDLAGIFNVAIAKGRKGAEREIDWRQIRLVVGLPEPRGGATSGTLVEPGGIEPPTS